MAEHPHSGFNGRVVQALHGAGKGDDPLRADAAEQLPDIPQVVVYLVVRSGILGDFRQLNELPVLIRSVTAGGPLRCPQIARLN